jgi:hypothetical protein
MNVQTRTPCQLDTHDRVRARRSTGRVARFLHHRAARAGLVLCLMGSLGLSGVAAPVARADGPGAGGDFVLDSSVLDGGTGANTVMASSEYVLQGSFGQMTANGVSASAEYVTGLGFWSTTGADFRAYMPVVLKA